MKARILVVCAAMGTAAVGDLSALAQTPYVFINIADTSGAFSFFNPDVAINDHGTVAFSASLDSGIDGVFTGSGGLTTTVADDTGQFEAFIGPVDLNNSGLAAFTASLDSGPRGIFTSNGGSLTTIEVAGPFSSVSYASINTSGMVSFRRSTISDQGIELGIYAGNGGPITTIADTSGPFRYISFGTAINDSGTVTFAADLKNFGGSGLFAGNGGPTATIVDSSGPFSGFVGFGRAINNSGTGAFGAIRDAGGSGVFTGSGGPVATVADDSGAFADFGATMPINDMGDVAFHATLDVGGAEGIYTGPDSVTNKVIRVGDSLFGSTLVELSIGLDINDSGAIAFGYSLANGVRGIAVASVVPEPGAWALAIVLFASMGVFAPGPRRLGSRD